MNRFMRTELLIGNEALERLQAAHVAIFGLGGVGSFTAEALARSGIGHLVLIDKDVVDITNINRQLIALDQTIGQAKVDVMAERILQINPNCQVSRKQLFFGESTAKEVFSEQIDFIADAIDTISAKIQLVLEADARSIPIISSMGAANKLDPGQFQILDIKKTSVDPIAKIMRKELKQRGFTNPLPVVCSTEQPRRTSKPPASIAFVPPVAGLMLASYIVKQIAKI